MMGFASLYPSYERTNNKFGQPVANGKGSNGS